MTKKLFLEIGGWYGTVVIVLAYLLLSFEVLSSKDLLYQTLNLTGALGITFSSLSKKDSQAGVLNAIWSFIALIAVIKIVFKL